MHDVHMYQPPPDKVSGRSDTIKAHAERSEQRDISLGICPLKIHPNMYTCVRTPVSPDKLNLATYTLQQHGCHECPVLSLP